MFDSSWCPTCDRRVIYEMQNRPKLTILYCLHLLKIVCLQALQIMMNATERTDVTNNASQIL